MTFPGPSPWSDQPGVHGIKPFLIRHLSWISYNYRKDDLLQTNREVLWANNIKFITEEYFTQALQLFTMIIKTEYLQK